MRTICFVNLKGGVAKTATTVNVAAILAKCHKQRVLIVDADSEIAFGMENEAVPQERMERRSATGRRQTGTGGFRRPPSPA